MRSWPSRGAGRAARTWLELGLVGVGVGVGVIGLGLVRLYHTGTRARGTGFAASVPRARAGYFHSAAGAMEVLGALSHRGV
mgnify:CR=1 FL=1